MFHSFYVTPKDRNFLRFLWFENNDLTKPIVEYQMNVHLFGAASSPGIANFCLHQTAETHRKEFGDVASDFLLRDFQVDDGLKSIPTAQEALQLINDSQTMCAKDNLRLHKFASNCKEVLEVLPANELRDKLLTRRGILLTISSVYDPLGGVSPVIMCVIKMWTGMTQFQQISRHFGRNGEQSSPF